MNKEVFVRVGRALVERFGSFAPLLFYATLEGPYVAVHANHESSWFAQRQSRGHHYVKTWPRGEFRYPLPVDGEWGFARGRYEVDFTSPQKCTPTEPTEAELAAQLVPPYGVAFDHMLTHWVDPEGFARRGPGPDALLPLQGELTLVHEGAHLAFEDHLGALVDTELDYFIGTREWPRGSGREIDTIAVMDEGLAVWTEIGTALGYQGQLRRYWREAGRGGAGPEEDAFYREVVRVVRNQRFDLERVAERIRALNAHAGRRCPE